LNHLRRCEQDSRNENRCSVVDYLVFASALGFGQGRKKSPPCSGAESQAEMTICWGKQYKAADAALNQVYKQLVAKLDDQERAQLKEAQTAWLKYRDTNCDFVADQYKGGSMRPMIYAICLADVTTNRTVNSRLKLRPMTYSLQSC
jgi:uncharacterized protein YecT (DUF1311 family)